MASVSRDRDRARLERQLETEEYQELLADLQQREPFLRRFTTWADVLAFMRQGTSQDPSKDEVLRPILAAHGEDGDHRWRVILLALFWPGLGSIPSTDPARVTRISGSVATSRSAWSQSRR